MVMSLKVWILVIAYVSAATSTAPAQYVPTLKKPGMPYSFSYGVKDGYRGTDFGQTEHSDGNLVTGTYSVQLPDGRKQTVKYEADHIKGFVADVSYIGEAQYPPPSKIPPFIVKHNVVGLKKTSKPLLSPELHPVHVPENRELFSDKELSLEPHGSPQIFLEEKELSIPKSVSIPEIHVASLPKHSSIHLQLQPHQELTHSKLIPKPQLIINEFDVHKKINDAKNIAFSHDDIHRGVSSGEKYLSDMDYDSERDEHTFHGKHSIQTSEKHEEEEEENEDDENELPYSGHRSKFSDKFEDKNLNSDEDEEKHSFGHDDDERKGKSFTAEKELDFQSIRHPFLFPHRLRSNPKNFFQPRYIHNPIVDPKALSIYRLLGSAYRPRSHPLFPLHLLQQRNKFRNYDSAEQLKDKQFFFSAYHQPGHHFPLLKHQPGHHFPLLKHQPGHHFPLLKTQILKSHKQDLTSKFEPNDDFHGGVEFDIAKQDLQKPHIATPNVLPNSPVYIPNNLRKDLDYDIKPSYQTLGNYQGYQGYGRPLDILQIPQKDSYDPSSATDSIVKV